MDSSPVMSGLKSKVHSPVSSTITPLTKSEWQFKTISLICEIPTPELGFVSSNNKS